MVIVAAIDRTKRAQDVIGQAEQLAKAFDETVHVVHVVSRKEFIEHGIAKAGRRQSVGLEDFQKAAKRIASDAADRMDVPHETVGLVGDRGPSVVEYASDHDAEYIVIAGRKRSPSGKAIFGSVGQTILLNADCPVITTTLPPTE